MHCPLKKINPWSMGRNKFHCRGKKYDRGIHGLHIWEKNGSSVQTDKNNNLSFSGASEGFEAVMLLNERPVMCAL